MCDRLHGELLMGRFTKPVALILAGLLVAGAVVTVRAATRGPGTYRVTAYFEKAIGLFPNSDVTILGVPVGKVTEVVPEGDKVRVEMEVSSEHKVPADAFAQVIPISVISDRYIQLAPPYEDGPALRDGAVLEVEDTQIPAELDDVFQQLKKLLDAIEPGRAGEPGALGDLIVAVNDALEDRAGELRGTLVTGSELTKTLADARGDLSGLLVNLDDLFGRLATRAGTIGRLNHNLALVMTALAESRDDIEGTLVNLASLTGEVGDVVRDHRERLGRDLNIAARITSTVLRNRASVSEALTWLPVVGEGAAKAYHGGRFKNTDVRDSDVSQNCQALGDLPDEVKDALTEIFEQFCGGEPSAPRAQASQTLGCERSVRRVERQIRRLAHLSDEIRADIIRPLRKRLKRIARECEALSDALGDPADILDRILEDVGGIPGTDPEETLDDALDDLVGNAAGAAGAVPTPEVSAFAGWVTGFLGFVGVRS